MQLASHGCCISHFRHEKGGGGHVWLTLLSSTGEFRTLNCSRTKWMRELNYLWFLETFGISLSVCELFSPISPTVKTWLEFVLPHHFSRELKMCWLALRSDHLACLGAFIFKLACIAPSVHNLDLSRLINLMAEWWEVFCLHLKESLTLLTWPCSPCSGVQFYFYMLI